MANARQTYYLTLDLSVRDFLERRPDDKVIHNTRAGYRVWYNPLFNAPEPQPSDPDLVEDNQDDGDLPEHEDRELDNIGLQQTADKPQQPIDPMLLESNAEPQQAGDAADATASEIQILELHSNEPLVSYRNHVFRGSWHDNIGTEMIFTPHDDTAPLPALRHLSDGIDLLAASSSRIVFKEAKLVPKDEAVLAPEAVWDGGLNDEELPERYKRNGGVYIHVGGDKSGQRQPQAHFLEDLITLKRSRGETDAVTVQPMETRENQLMVNDEEEERRRKKLQTDQARANKWRELRKGNAAPPEPDAMGQRVDGRRGRGRGRGGSMRGRGRRPLLLRTQDVTSSSPAPGTNPGASNPASS